MSATALGRGHQASVTLIRYLSKKLPQMQQKYHKEDCHGADGWSPRDATEESCWGGRLGLETTRGTCDDVSWCVLLRIVSSCRIVAEEYAWWASFEACWGTRLGRETKRRMCDGVSYCAIWLLEELLQKGTLDGHHWEDLVSRVPDYFETYSPASLHTLGSFRNRTFGELCKLFKAVRKDRLAISKWFKQVVKNSEPCLPAVDAEEWKSSHFAVGLGLGERPIF